MASGFKDKDKKQRREETRTGKPRTWSSKKIRDKKRNKKLP